MSGDVSFVLDQATYVAAAKLCFRHQLRSRRLYGRLLMIAAIAAVMAGGVVMVTGGGLGDAITIGAGGVFGGLLVLAIIIGGSYLLLPRNNRRLFNQDRSIAGPTRFHWDDEATSWQSSASRYEARWDQHHAWAVNAEVMIFFANERLYRLLPVAVVSQVQIAEIIERLEAARPSA